MALVVETPIETVETLADLLAQLGGIAPERVLRHPAPGTATEADVVALRDSLAHRLCELIDGVLVEKAMGFRESYLALALAAILRQFVRQHRLGLVVGADGMMRLFPGRVRIPDAAFVAWDRLPGRRVPTEPIPAVAPNLAVEVWSPSNTSGEMALKRQEYFAAGVQLVWEVYPTSRTVQVFTAPEQSTTFQATDTLDGGSVLPGFTLPLQSLFEELDESGDASPMP